MKRGPGTLSMSSRVVFPWIIAARPSSTCTKTLTIQPSMMNHSSVKPFFAPTTGVAINSPEPTMQAVMIRPGPRCLRMPPQCVGASWGCVVSADIDGKVREFALAHKDHDANSKAVEQIACICLTPARVRLWPAGGAGSVFHGCDRKTVSFRPATIWPLYP